MKRYDAIVIGGGLVGSAIAYGLAREGLTRADRRRRRRVPRLARQFRPRLGAVQRFRRAALSALDPALVGRMAGACRRAARRAPASLSATSGRAASIFASATPSSTSAGPAWSRCAPRPAISASSTACSTAASSPTCCPASAQRWSAPRGPRMTAMPIRSICCTRCTKGLSTAAGLHPEPHGRLRRRPAQRFPPWLSARRDRRAEDRPRRRARQRQARPALRAERAGPPAARPDPRHRAGQRVSRCRPPPSARRSRAAS